MLMGKDSPVLDIRLSHNKLGDSVIKSLAGLLYKSNCEVRKLALSDTDMTAEGANEIFESLIHNQNLHHLNIS